MPPSRMIRAVSAASAVSLLALGGAHGFAPQSASAPRERTSALYSQRRRYKVGGGGSSESGASVQVGGADDPWPNASPFPASDSADGQGGRQRWSSSSASPAASATTFAPQPTTFAPMPATYSTGAGSSASIPFMITQKMKRVLIEELRYTRSEVNAMSAESARTIIECRIANPRPLKNGYNTNNGGAQEDGQRGAAPKQALRTHSFEGVVAQEEATRGDAEGEVQQHVGAWWQYDSLMEVGDEETIYGDDSTEGKWYSDGADQYDMSVLPSESSRTVICDASYAEQYEEASSTSTLEQMDEQFGELTERVLSDDRYGPSVFSRPERANVQHGESEAASASQPVVRPDPIGAFDMGR